MKMEPTDQLIKDVCERLTDCIFFYLQNDREFMTDYLSASKKKRDTFNKTMGKAIKGKFKLGDVGECHNPRSVLIKSYTKHCKYCKHCKKIK